MEEEVGGVMVRTVLTPFPVPIPPRHVVVPTTPVEKESVDIAPFQGLLRERASNAIVLVHEVEGKDGIRRL